MSNRRRPRGKTALSKWPEPGPGESYCHQPAVVSDRFDQAMVDSGRRLSHDSLIEQTGSRRRSGIWWTHYLAGEGRDFMLEAYRGADLNAEEREGFQGYLERLQDPRALLVVAWCIAEAPEGVRLR